MPKLIFLIPVFNEAPNIPILFEGLTALKNEFQDSFSTNFILVDDGSSDGTADVARETAGALPLEVISHEVNRGPGAAFATGFSRLAERISEQDWVITMEGDNTSRHELVKQMITRSREGFDVVLASPYMYGGGFTQTSFLRKLLSGGANLLVKDLLGIQGILTASSFFRLFSGRSILHLQRVFGSGVIERTGFESMVEMIMKMVLLQLPISEVAMRLDSSRRKGKSKMKIMRTIIGYMALWRCKDKWIAQAAKAEGETRKSSSAVSYEKVSAV